MSNNLLPSQPICYSGLERVSLSVSQLLRRFSDDRQKGSVTAEAAVAVPVFFLAVVTMLYLLEMMAVHTAVRSGLQYAGKKTAKESCVTQMLMPSRIENDLVYAVGEERLGRSIVRGGSSGIDCSRSKMSARTGIGKLTAEYQVVIPVPLFGIAPVKCSETMKIKAWSGYEREGWMDTGNDTVYVTETGLVEKTVEIRLNEKKIEKVNNQILGIAVDKLDDAQAELDDTKKKLKDAKAELKSNQEKLQTEQTDKTKELAEYSKMLDEAMATKAAYAAQLVGLQADETALKTERKAYVENKVVESYDQINAGFQTAKETLTSDETYQAVYTQIYTQVKIAAVQQAVVQAGITDTIDATNVDTYLAMLGDAAAAIEQTAQDTAKEMTEQQIAEQAAQIPENVKDALDNPDKLKVFKKLLDDQSKSAEAV